MTIHQEIKDLKGVVLIGGKSSRMGVDKYNLNYQGQTLLEKTYKHLHSLGLDVNVSCSLDQKDLLEQQYKLVIDHQLEGPLSGILSAMNKLQSSVFILAIDYPFLTQKSLEFLLDHRNKNKKATIMYASNTKNWPCLCSIFELSALKELNVFFDSGQRSVRKFIESIPFQSLPFDNNEFYNLNTREDYQKLISGNLK